MAIHWEEDLKTGVPAIDEQHEEIFAVFDKLTEAIEDGEESKEIGKLLDYLAKYATRHFSDEETLMSLYKYTGLEEQRLQHAQFKDNIGKLSEMLSSGVATKEIAIKVNATLIRYFINHVRKLDREMADVVKPDLKS